MSSMRTEPAVAAYEAMAPFYDRYTASYDYERWLANIERIAQDLGLRGRRLLDVACGTGKSFEPMLARGYEVVACDLSPAMVTLARERFGEDAEVFVADMRDLPDYGAFDVLTCLDDSLNYLLDEDELRAAFRGFARSLSPSGLAVFDLNSLATYRGFFARDAVAEDRDTLFCWRGEAGPHAAPGSVASSVVEIFSTSDGESWRRTSSRHVQRHHPPTVVRKALAASGLELLELRGQVTGAQIDSPADERRHTKLVYFARPARGTAANEGGD